MSTQMVLQSRGFYKDRALSPHVSQQQPRGGRLGSTMREPEWSRLRSEEELRNGRHHT